MKTCLKMTDVLFSATFCLFKKNLFLKLQLFCSCVTLSSDD